MAQPKRRIRCPQMTERAPVPQHRPTIGRSRPFPRLPTADAGSSLRMTAVEARLSTCECRDGKEARTHRRPKTAGPLFHQKGGSGPQKTRLTRHSRALARFPTLAIHSFGWTSTRSAFCAVHMEGKQLWQSWGDIFGNVDCPSIRGSSSDLDHADEQYQDCDRIHIPPCAVRKERSCLNEIELLDASIERAFGLDPYGHAT